MRRKAFLGGVLGLFCFLKTPAFSEIELGENLLWTIDLRMGGGVRQFNEVSKDFFSLKDDIGWLFGGQLRNGLSFSRTDWGFDLSLRLEGNGIEPMTASEEWDYSYLFSVEDLSFYFEGENSFWRIGKSPVPWGYGLSFQPTGIAEGEIDEWTPGEPGKAVSFWNLHNIFFLEGYTLEWIAYSDDPFLSITEESDFSESDFKPSYWGGAFAHKMSLADNLLDLRWSLNGNLLLEEDEYRFYSKIGLESSIDLGDGFVGFASYGGSLNWNELETPDQDLGTYWKSRFLIEIQYNSVQGLGQEDTVSLSFSHHEVFYLNFYLKKGLGELFWFKILGEMNLSDFSYLSQLVIGYDLNKSIGLNLSALYLSSQSFREGLSKQAFAGLPPAIENQLWSQLNALAIQPVWEFRLLFSLLL